MVVNAILLQRERGQHAHEGLDQRLVPFPP